MAARRTGSGAHVVRPGAAIVLSALLLAGCNGDTPPAQQQAPPPPEVGIVTLSSQPVVDAVEVPGRLQAVRIAEVRARVDGIIQKRLYEEGSDVRAGQKLFAIDPREMQAQLNAAEATLARARATLANAQQDVDRYQGLVEQQAISQQEYDTAVARLRTAKADVSQASAQVQAARLNLGYTTVTAPIAGRAGRAQVTEGALVSATQATLLTTIEQLDPIYANFSLSSSERLAIRREIESGALKVPDRSKIPVHLLLEDGTRYGQTGRLDFLDLRIDENTGSTALRAEFPNDERVLLPGQFVRVRIEAGVRTDALLVPQRAVNVTPQGATVMVVGEKDAVEARTVELGPMQGGSWAVVGGLAAGDRVIVDGLQKIQPGQPVRPVPANPEGDTQPAAATPR